AQPRLDDRNVHAGSRELGERSRSQSLELRRLDALGRTAHTLERGREVGVFATDLNPLAPARHVRRRVGADREAFPPKKRRGSASTTSGAAFSTKRSLASIFSARSTSLRKRSISAAALPFAATRSGLTTASKIRCSSSSSRTRTPLRRKIAAASWTRSSARSAS